MHALDLLLLAICVAVLTLATRARIVLAAPARRVERPRAEKFEGILINHQGQVRRVPPACSPLHVTPRR
jgi:hypothetical protein